jgi:hypothetical protein
LFTVKHSSLWEKQTSEDEIRILLTEYGIAKESNSILNVSVRSLSDAFKEWRERLKFLGISCEALQVKYPVLTKVFDTFSKIYQQAEIMPDQVKIFLSELITHSGKIKELLTDDKRVFTEVYAPYLENLSNDDIADVKSKLPVGLFELSKTDCNAKVKEAAEEFRKNQLKSQLFRLWKERTGTKNPREWSSRYRTPILCCVPEADYEKVRRVFDTLNRNWGTDIEIKTAIDYLEKTSLYKVLSDDNKRDTAFELGIIGEYRILLHDLNKVRDSLELLSVDHYDWGDNPSVKNKVRQLAEAEYNAGGSDKVLEKIDKMDGAKLKQYLKRLIKDSITVGIEILSNEDK